MGWEVQEVWGILRLSGVLRLCGVYIYMFIEVSADGFYVIRDFSGISAWV